MRFGSRAAASAAVTRAEDGWDGGESELPSEFETLGVEVDLGKKMQFHSIFVCPVLREESTLENPAMLLRCAHVVSRDAIRKLRRQPQLRFKCPYCATEQGIGDCRIIRF